MKDEFDSWFDDEHSSSPDFDIEGDADDVLYDDMKDPYEDM